MIAVGREAESELRALYGRCKALGLGAGAALILGDVDPALTRQAAELRADAGRAAARDRGGLAVPLAACRRAAEALERLLGHDGDRDALLAEARATQRALRREVWKVLPCEYEPCGAGAAHARGDD